MLGKGEKFEIGEYDFPFPRLPFNSVIYKKSYSYIII